MVSTREENANVIIIIATFVGQSPAFVGFVSLWAWWAMRTPTGVCMRVRATPEVGGVRAYLELAMVSSGDGERLVVCKAWAP